jgi:hypothetical protein
VAVVVEHREMQEPVDKPGDPVVVVQVLQPLLVI